MKKPIIAITAIAACVMLAACSAPHKDEIITTIDPAAATEAAPTPAPEQPLPEEDVDGMVQDMMPILDSIVRTIGIEGEGQYDPQDEGCFWYVLQQMGVNWGQTHPLYEKEGDTIILPRQVMQEFASAAFYEYDDLLPVPEYLAESVAYDEGLDAYRLAPSDMGDSYTELESVTRDGDRLNVTVALYVGDGELLGHVDFVLISNPYSDGITDPTYYYSVVDAVARPFDVTWQQVDMTAPFSADFDGDGQEETVSFTRGDEDSLKMAIEYKGDAFEHDFSYFYNPSCYLADTYTADGVLELYVMGDVASDDYVTYIYRFVNGSIEQTELYGSVTGVSGNCDIYLDVVVNVLGTYGASCVYHLGAAGFELFSDYTVDIYDNMEYYTITTQKAGLPVTYDDGTKGTLQAGVKLWLVSTDAVSSARLMTEDEKYVTIELTHDDSYWGWKIDGVTEEEWFGMLSYAG